MNFRIQGLPRHRFEHLFGLPDSVLTQHRAQRHFARGPGGYPCRVSLADYDDDGPMLLVHFTHQAEETPYHASHAIYVREAVTHVFDAKNTVPPVLRPRMLSLRAFDRHHQMIDADLIDGQHVESLIERFFADAATTYIHAHFARRGCFAARIDRG